MKSAYSRVFAMLLCTILCVSGTPTVGIAEELQSLDAAGQSQSNADDGMTDAGAEGWDDGSPLDIADGSSSTLVTDDAETGSLEEDASVNETSVLDETPVDADPADEEEPVAEDAVVPSDEVVVVDDEQLDVVQIQEVNGTEQGEVTVEPDKQTGETPTAQPTKKKAKVSYRSYVQSAGWQRWRSNGKVSGTQDQGLRIEGIRMKLSGVEGGISYRSYVQSKGWQSWRSNGKLSGMTGRGRRLEAFQVKLTGAAKKAYDVYYRASIQKVGWTAWAKNGKKCGTYGLGFRMEAIQVVLVEKGGAAPSASDATVSFTFLGKPKISYSANAKGLGWLSALNGKTVGKSSAGSVIRQLSATLSNLGNSGIRYAVRLNGDSWQSWEKNGTVVGDAHKSVNAVRFKLTGDAASYYNVWYRVCVSGLGWQGWTKNGKAAGSDSALYPITALQVRVVAKSAKSPGKTLRPFVKTKSTGTVESTLAIAYADLGYSAATDPLPGSKAGRYCAKLMGEPWMAGPSTEIWWCCMWVSMVLDKADVFCPGFPTQNTDLALNGGARAKAISNRNNVRRGDIVIFDWDWDGVTDHIGFATGSRNGSSVPTIEGNTSNAVRERSRSLFDVAYVIRPDYAK